MSSSPHDTSFPEDAGRTLFHQAPGVDWLLVQLIGYAEAGINISLTLQVAGAFLYGELISSQLYFELLSAQFRSANWGGPRTANASPGAIAEAMDRFGKAIALIENNGTQPQFMHLRHVRLLAGDAGRAHAGAPLLWRIKLADISGFSAQQLF